MPTKLDPFLTFGHVAGHGRGSDGRSEWRRGLLKREGGFRYARDVVPGHSARPEWSDRGGPTTVQPKVAPDDTAKD